jgi:hypothetical protein
VKAVLEILLFCDEEADLSMTSLRAILDIGLLDMQPQYLKLKTTELHPILAMIISNAEKQNR